MPTSSKRSLSFRFPQQNVVCISSIRAAHPVHLILLDLITQITFCKTWTSRSSSLCNFFHILDIYSLTDTNISLGFLCPSLNVRKYAPRPHQTKYIINVKVIFTLEQDAKTHWGVEVQLYSFSNLGVRWGGWPTPRPVRFNPGTDPTPIIQGAGWTQGSV